MISLLYLAHKMLHQYSTDISFVQKQHDPTLVYYLFICLLRTIFNRTCK